MTSFPSVTFDRTTVESLKLARISDETVIAFGIHCPTLFFLVLELRRIPTLPGDFDSDSH